MGLVSPELTLDLKPSFVPETVNGFLKQVSIITDASEKLDKLDHFVNRLEDEMKKIEVFKRELPLCMLLLKDAISVLKQESTQFRTKNAHQPVLEEFIPMSKESEDATSQIDDSKRRDEMDSSRDKKDWMSSVQLWSSDNVTPSNSQNSHHNQTQTQTQTLVSQNQKEEDKRSKLVGDNMYEPCKTLTGSKEFVPLIQPYPKFGEMRRKVEENVGIPQLSMLIPGMVEHHKDGSLANVLNSRFGGGRVSSSASPAIRGNSSHQQSSIRKQRRCWSPELHRRFVDALTQLGGPQVATPKQIRELMRVDGLTNDEVKSHLQKYRLHTRRSPNQSSASRNEITASSQDHCSDSLKPSNSQSGSPQGPLQFPGLTGVDSMEDDDDEKSESYSWKGQLHRPRPGKDDV